MASLLAIYGESVARSVNFFCFLGCVGAFAVACIAGNEGKSDLARKCLWTTLIFAIVMTLFPGPDFFKALAGRP